MTVCSKDITGQDSGASLKLGDIGGRVGHNLGDKEMKIPIWYRREGTNPTIPKRQYDLTYSRCGRIRISTDNRKML